MKEKLQKLLKKLKKVLICALITALLGCCMYLVYVHRRVIKAALKGEPMPKCPHWLPRAFKKKYGF